MTLSIVRGLCVCPLHERCQAKPGGWEDHRALLRTRVLAPPEGPAGGGHHAVRRASESDVEWQVPGHAAWSARGEGGAIRETPAGATLGYGPMPTPPGLVPTVMGALAKLINVS